MNKASHPGDRSKYIYNFVQEKKLNLAYCPDTERTERLLRQLADDAYNKELNNYKALKN